MQILYIKLISVLRKYWWLWLVLFVISITVILVGPSIFGHFIFNVFRFIFAVYLFGAFYWYTLGRGVIGMWAVMRLIGCLGLLLSIGGVAEQLDGTSLSNIMSQPVTDIKRSNLQLMILLSIASLFMVGMGEILLYLHKLNYKSRNSHVFHRANYLFLQKMSTEMTCPRCTGKGWVDLTDIERLGMTDKEPGICIYCEGQGYVERGHSNNYDPREDEEYHEKMEERRRKAWKGREEEQAALGKDFENFKKQYEQEQYDNNS